MRKIGIIAALLLVLVIMAGCSKNQSNEQDFGERPEQQSAAAPAQEKTLDDLFTENEAVAPPEIPS